jgi:hypothetical protein
VQLVPKETPVQKEILVQVVHSEIVAQQEIPGRLAPKVIQVQPVKQEHLGLKVQQVPKVQPVQPAPRVLSVQLDLKETPVQPEPKETLEQLV